MRNDNLYDIDTISTSDFFGKLKKGDEFNIHNRQFKVVSVSKSGNIKMNIDGKNKKIIHKYNDYFGTLGYGVDWLSNVIRDIEGILIIDSININNQFHEPSYFYKKIFG